MGNAKRMALGRGRTLEDTDRALRVLLASLPAETRQFFLEVLLLDRHRRDEIIGKLHETGRFPALTEPLMQAGKDRAVMALLVGLLREADR